MANNVVRTCPNCGTPLGQKNLCPDGLQYRCRYYSHFYDQAQFAYIVSPE